MARSGSWQDMPSIVTDEMLEKFVPRGTYDQIGAIYRERYTGLTRRITFPMPTNPAHDLAATKAITDLKTGSRVSKALD
jgi:hypothetical protein